MKPSIFPLAADFCLEDEEEEEDDEEVFELDPIYFILEIILLGFG